ncbi:MAG: sigma-54-dependent Fis family transcriptional regulator [Planctomycetia bacterium]|nr:MAG: sigma-54-dependent Fis family transcriptional regulator [Planctomycetia bacterium]
MDDEPLKRITLQIELSEQGYEVYEAADAPTACRIFDSKPIDVVVSDVRMPGMGGLDLLSYVKRARPGVGVILMTAYATVDHAVLAIKRGAHDYITKPFTTPELVAKLDHLLVDGASRASDGGSDDGVACFGQLITVSAAMKRLFAQLASIADSDRTVLLCGESGTGKELFSEAIHRSSARAEHPFVACSCAALGPGVLESELFGHEKGAFTSAIRQKAGRFELADNGTLLLDEVDDIPLEVQVKLLRVVERREFERVGGEQPVRSNVRLICATKRDLSEMVRAGRFREDLYYRLNVITANIPPLRDRSEDIPLLARHFIQKHAALAAGPLPQLSPAACEELLRHRWPGNVRELEHVIERALVFCNGSAEIRPEHVLPLAPPAAASDSAALEPALSADGHGLADTMADIERRMILVALRQCAGNQARAAQRLNIPRTTLRDKMAKYGIAGA